MGDWQEGKGRGLGGLGMDTVRSHDILERNCLYEIDYYVTMNIYQIF